MTQQLIANAVLACFLLSAAMFPQQLCIRAVLLKYTCTRDKRRLRVVSLPLQGIWIAALGPSDETAWAVWLQAQAQAQAQNMAFQAHNLQAHAQQLEVESAHPVSSHINVGLQHQVDQVHTVVLCQHLSLQAVQMCALFGVAMMQLGNRSVPVFMVKHHASWRTSMWSLCFSPKSKLLPPFAVDDQLAVQLVL